MDFSSVFRTHDFLEDAAVSYGFKKKGGVFTLERALPETDGLAAVVTVHGREMTVSVVELPDRVPYVLFEVESAEGLSSTACARRRRISSAMWWRIVSSIRMCGAGFFRT